MPATTVESLIYELKVDDKASKVFDAWEKKLTKKQKTAGKTSSFVEKSLKKMAKEAVDFGKKSIAAFEDYENQLALVSKTTGLAGEELNQFGNEIRDLAGPIGALKAENLLEVATVAGQLGIQGKEDIKAFSVSVGKGAIALDSFAGNTEKLALHLAKAQNIFKLTVADTDAMLSTYSKLATTTAATELQISNFNLAMSRGAALMQLSIQESSALGAVFSAAGLQVSSSARLMTSAFLNMTQGGAKVAAAADLITFSLDKGAASISELEQITGKSRSSFESLGEMIQTALGTDALATMTVLAKQLAISSNQTEDLTIKTQAAASATDAFGKTGIPVMTALGQAAVKASDDIESLEFIMQTANDAFESADEHLIAYNRQVEKSGEASKVLGSAINDIMITVGGPLLKAFAKFLNTYLIPITTEFGTWLRQSDLIKESLPQFLSQLSSSLGTVLQKVAEVVKELDWKQLFNSILKGFRTLTTAAEKFITGFDTGQAVRGINALFKGIENLVSMVDSAMSTLSTLGIGLKQIYDLAVGISSVFGHQKDLVANDWADGVIPTVQEGIKNMKAYQKTIENSTGAMKQHGKVAYGQSVLPDIVMWAGKATQSINAMGTATDAATAKMAQGQAMLDSLRNRPSSSYNPIQSGMSGGAGLLQGLNQSRQSSGGQQLQQQAQTTNIVFQGQNIIDPASQSRFTRAISRGQQSQNARRVQGSTPIRRTQ